MQVSRPGAWQPGQSGNPRGRVRDSVREELRRLAKKKRPDGSTNVHAVASKAWELAADGSIKAIVFVTEQIDGKVPTPVEHTGADGAPISVTFTVQPSPAAETPEG